MPLASRNLLSVAANRRGFIATPGNITRQEALDWPRCLPTPHKVAEKNRPWSRPPSTRPQGRSSCLLATPCSVVVVRFEEVSENALDLAEVVVVSCVADVCE